VAGQSMAQDRLKMMPGYDNYERISREMTNAMPRGSISVTWTNDGTALDYRKDGKPYRYDLVTHTARLRPAPVATPRAEEASARRGSRRLTHDGTNRVARGRQFPSALSPDDRFKAFYRDRNLWLSAADGKNERAITTDGSDKTRIKYGTANWVYG